jgi:Haem degrading protein HbpS-like
MAKLRAAECRDFIQAVTEKAAEMGVPITVAIVGPEGHLIALERMERRGLHHARHGTRKSVHRGGVQIHEPSLYRRARHPAMVQGTQSADADQCVGVHERPGSRFRRRRAGIRLRDASRYPAWCRARAYAPSPPLARAKCPISSSLVAGRAADAVSADHFVTLGHLREGGSRRSETVTVAFDGRRHG